MSPENPDPNYTAMVKKASGGVGWVRYETDLILKTQVLIGELLLVQLGLILAYLILMLGQPDARRLPWRGPDDPQTGERTLWMREDYHSCGLHL